MKKANCGLLAVLVALGLFPGAATQAAPIYTKTGTNTLIATSAATNTFTSVAGLLESVQVGVRAGQTAGVSIVAAEGVLLDLAGITSSNLTVRPRVPVQDGTGTVIAGASAQAAMYGSVTARWTGASAGTNAVSVRILYSR
jgi:hypothetical protein